MPYRLSPLAEQDLDEIWSYVAEDAAPTTADRLVDDIIHRFGLLAEQPGMGRALRNSALACDLSQSRTTSSTIVKKATTF